QFISRPAMHQRCLMIARGHSGDQQSLVADGLEVMEPRTSRARETIGEVFARFRIVATHPGGHAFSEQRARLELRLIVLLANGSNGVVQLVRAIEIAERS